MKLGLWAHELETHPDSWRWIENVIVPKFGSHGLNDTFRHINSYFMCEKCSKNAAFVLDIWITKPSQTFGLVMIWSLIVRSGLILCDGKK